MNKIFNCIVVILSVLQALTSCGGGSTASFDGEPVTMRYATLLKMTEGDGYVAADVKNPWSNDSTTLLHRYILVPRNEQLPENLPEGELIRTPLQKAVIYTSVHASLINQLGGYDAIKGVCDVKYMYLDKLQEDVKAGKIINCGESVNPNIERIIDLSPDAILLSPFENSGSYGRLGKLGIPIIECADYMETGPLSRAEWMRFYGMLVGHQQEADSLFHEVETDYNETAALVKDSHAKPTIVAEKKLGDSWYVAGANSTMGRMYADAGADYIFSDEAASGSVPYDPELVFDRAQQADLWLIKYNQATPLTLQQLGKEWPNYTRMKPYMTHHVYGCNLSQVPFYEETPFHPNILLRDLISIFHPATLQGHTPRYFQLLK